MATKSNKAGPKSWTAKQLEAIRVYFVETRGNVRKTSTKFKTSDQTICRLARIHGWRADIPKIAAETRKLSNRTVAESHAVTLSAIDKYLDKQHEYINDGRIKSTVGSMDGFDASGVERLVKTRELLTGGATDRLDAGDLFAKFDALDDDGKRNFIAKLRERAARLRGESA